MQEKSLLEMKKEAIAELADANEIVARVKKR